MFGLSVTVSGFEQVEAAFKNVNRFVEEGGDRISNDIAQKLAEGFSRNAHLRTGALASAFRWSEAVGGGDAQVFIDPAVVNRFNQRPAEYGPFERARGGSHDYEAITFATVLEPAMQAAIVDSLRRYGLQ